MGTGQRVPEDLFQVEARFLARAALGVAAGIPTKPAGCPRRMQAHRGSGRPWVLGIVSGKGGVGKSTLAVNLATAAAGAGAKTLLVDGDLGLANTDLLMGMIPKYDLEDWCDRGVALDDVVCEGPAGLRVVVAGRRK